MSAFTVTAGMYSIGPLGRSDNPLLPFGTILVDRSDCLNYIIVRTSAGAVDLQTVTFKNGLRTYNPFEPFSGPVLSGKRLYSDNGVLNTENIVGHIVNSSPINNLTTDKTDVYELLDVNDTLTWVLV